MTCDTEGEQRQNFTQSKCGARWGWVVNSTFRPVYSMEINLATIEKNADWVPGLVWKDQENRGTSCTHRSSK
jgi:hypothetical protein